MTGPEHRPRFREDGMTFLDFVRDVLGQPDLPDDKADAILWELTPFPLVRGRDDLRPYLEQVRDGTCTYESVYAGMEAAYYEDAEPEPPAATFIRRAPREITAEPKGDLL